MHANYVGHPNINRTTANIDSSLRWEPKRNYDVDQKAIISKLEHPYPQTKLSQPIVSFQGSQKPALSSTQFTGQRPNRKSMRSLLQPIAVLLKGFRTDLQSIRNQLQACQGDFQSSSFRSSLIDSLQKLSPLKKSNQLAGRLEHSRLQAQLEYLREKNKATSKRLQSQMGQTYEMYQLVEKLRSEMGAMHSKMLVSEESLDKRRQENESLLQENHELLLKNQQLIQMLRSSNSGSPATRKFSFQSDDKEIKPNFYDRLLVQREKMKREHLTQENDNKARSFEFKTLNKNGPDGSSLAKLDRLDKKRSEVRKKQVSREALGGPSNLSQRSRSNSEAKYRLLSEKLEGVKKDIEKDLSKMKNGLAGP